MKDELTLIHKIWFDLKEKECCKRILNVEEWKQNWDEVFMNKVRREREREEKERGERERGKKNVINVCRQKKMKGLIHSFS
jgi:hypothetical protein